MANSKINETKFVKMCDNLNLYAEELYQALKLLNSGYTKLMSEDTKEGPYWNGPYAAKFYSKAKNNMKWDIEGYKETAESWQRLYNRWIRLGRANKF